MNYLNCKQWKW